MHEYEFRVVVEGTTSFLPLLHSLRLPLQHEIVYYMKPHFRFRGSRFETKEVENTHAVYHDGMWFRWVQSIETPYSSWSKSTCSLFLHHVGNYQQPLTAERRTKILLDRQAHLYTFQTAYRTYRLVFEWEYGTFSKPPTIGSYDDLLHSLSRYRNIYQLFTSYASPPFKLNEEMSRRPVTTLTNLPEQECLYALKLDGTFGFVFSYDHKIKEKWEGNECVVRPSVSIGGGGFVFAAERLKGGQVYLLDVYQVRGHTTAPWCRQHILTDFLQNLVLPEGYFVQKYVGNPDLLQQDPPFETDGLIAHNIKKDLIFKVKTHHSIDLVYYEGYFYLPHGRFKCTEKGLEEGRVYELSMEGRVLRCRKDRFKGNTAAQLETILSHGWLGPSIEPLPTQCRKKKKH